MENVSSPHLMPFNGLNPSSWIYIYIEYHVHEIITPRAHARARGYVIGRGVYILYIYCILYIVWTFFWNQSFISKNTHFERSILTQIGFSLYLMASGTA